MLKQLIVIVGIIGVLAAESNPLKFSGQVRQRYEMVNKDFSDTTGFNNKNYLRTRFAVTYKSEDVMTFVQLQDTRIFGTETSTLKDGTADALDVHQAYFKLNHLFGMPLSAKVGRFEAVYGPQRLIGSVGWHNIGRSFDGVVFNYTTKFSNVDFFNYKQVEAGTIEDDDDFNVRGACAMCCATAEKIREHSGGVMPAAVRAVNGLIRVCHCAQLIETGAAIGAIIFVQGHV